ncbi:MAG: tetratricopeptide repeat protein [Ignavibacteriaceae bacterium]
MKNIVLTLILLLFAGGWFYFADAQLQVDAMKAEAQREMQFGRYGEAIDLLNRYISARPQQPEGYNLRGLCNEKREQFEYAVYDYRSALKLAPADKEINQNLARTTQLWYSLLYNQIEGYKREIAINPDKPENYLEVGKAYKNLGQWSVAEEWYDKYLARAHASPDEIIRYSEILAKNNHIAKGWPILKKYTEEYPNDQRLWSRFGYFSLWLGKNKIAIDAFQNSLALKPFFREAQSGLDEAKGKGYIYTVNDTSIKHFNYGLPPVQPAFVYPIDKYYRILKNNPADNDTRLVLIKALYKANRFEEASQQLKILKKNLGMQ